MQSLGTEAEFMFDTILGSPTHKLGIWVGFICVGAAIWQTFCFAENYESREAPVGYLSGIYHVGKLGKLQEFVEKECLSNQVL